jgi:hypothetical protein
MRKRIQSELQSSGYEKLTGTATSSSAMLRKFRLKGQPHRRHRDPQSHARRRAPRALRAFLGQRRRRDLAKGSGPDWTRFTSRPKADSGTAVTIRLVFATLTVVALEKLDGR